MGTLIHHICETKQIFTQSPGTRPFGCSLLWASIPFSKDKHKDRLEEAGEGTYDKLNTEECLHDVPLLYKTDPSGQCSLWKACCIGKRSEEINKFLEQEISIVKQKKKGLDSLSLNSALSIAWKS